MVALNQAGLFAQFQVIGKGKKVEATMNRIARRSRVDIGLAYLVEVIADVLQEANDSGPVPLLVEDIKYKAGFSNAPFVNQIVRGILNQMKQDGAVNVEKDERGYQVWWLMDG